MGVELVNALNIMWQGMLGIFAVMIVISLIVRLLAKLTK
jgi:hypothetical protein